MEENYEYVNHPSHYKEEGRMECIDEMLALFGKSDVETFCRLSAYKYLYRAGSKPGEEAAKDKAKARWYLDKAEEVKHGRLMYL